MKALINGCIGEKSVRITTTDESDNSRKKGVILYDHVDESSFAIPRWCGYFGVPSVGTMKLLKAGSEQP